MNDQASTMMNQNQHQHQPQMMSMNQHQPQQQVTKPLNYMVSNRNLMGVNYLKTPQSNNNPQMMLNQPAQQMINRSYGMWGPPLPPPSMDQLKFQNPNPKMMPPPGGLVGGFVPGKQQHLGAKVLGPRSNWKGKKVNDKRKDGRRKESIGMSVMAGTSSGVGGISSAGGGGGVGGYKPPMLKELQHQNRVKARRFFTKKKFNHHHYYHNNNAGGYNMGKFAPRNTSSFIIRAKKSGGIAELVSPGQVTPAVLPTPIFSPSREVLVDMAKEEWGVDGYGSMKGLIRLRSPGREDEVHEGDEEDEEGGSSESDVEEHVEVERRLDHDLSRFEMIYPNYAGGMDYSNVLENRVDDQDTHIAQLEEENLILKERLFLMERELGDLRRRLHCLERQSNRGGEDINEEVVENESENESESRGEAHSMEDNNEEFFGENIEGFKDMNQKEEKKNDVDDNAKGTTDDNNIANAEGYKDVNQEEGRKNDFDDNRKGTTSDNNIADVEGKGEKDEATFEVKNESLVEDVELKEENNDGKVGEDEGKDKISSGGLESAAGADVPMDEVSRADKNGIAESHIKDEAAGKE